MEVVCGIYCIENLINHKKYIGQSMDVYNRWNAHKNALNGNRHRNTYLQRAWNKYGKDNFNFYIIEKCNSDIIDELEKFDGIVIGTSAGAIIGKFETQGKFVYNYGEGKSVVLDKTMSSSRSALNPLLKIPPSLTLNLLLINC